MVLRLNYVTNLRLEDDSTRGGWGGMNAAVHAELAHRFDVRYVGPVHPLPDVGSLALSKILRKAGLPGAFHYYSPRRLRRIAEEVSQSSTLDADLDFFHGATPWIAYRSKRPYFAYVDAAFTTYLDLYQPRETFSSSDVARVCHAEAVWMRRATRIFFSSQWALDEAVRAYGLPRDNLEVSGLGGHIDAPATDSFRGGPHFLLVTTDFERKGGSVALDAFALLREEVPDAELLIVGRQPPRFALQQPGVRYLGFMNKAVPKERARLEGIFSQVRALLLPTLGDTTPIIIAELAYFGCPTIAPRRFGIPEMVVSGVSGCLVEEDAGAAGMAGRMLELCEDERGYARLRKSTRAHALEHFTWRSVGDRLAKAIVHATTHSSATTAQVTAPPRGQPAIG